jgi:hypothetical protein
MLTVTVPTGTILCPDCRDCFADCDRCGGLGYVNGDGTRTWDRREGGTGEVRVLITGSREFTDRQIIAQALSQVRRENGYRTLVVVHGAARGADTLAAAVVQSADPGRARQEAYPVTDAEWRPDGPGGRLDYAAGPRRNKRMVESGADVCLAFFVAGAKNTGTKHCSNAAEKAGIPVRKFEQSPW